MSKIITKAKAYTTRNGEECFIKLSIDDFNESKEKGGFNAIVTDTAVIFEDIETPGPTPEDPPIITSTMKDVIVLGKRAVYYPYANIDALFSQIGDPIEASENFSEQLTLLQGKALLIVTQLDPLYGTTAADWKLV